MHNKHIPVARRLLQLNIGKKASDFIKKSAKVFVKDNSIEDDSKNDYKDYLVENAYDNSDEGDSKTTENFNTSIKDNSIIKTFSKNKLDGFERKLRESKLNKLEQNVNNRIDKIEGRLFTLENYEEDHDKTLILHDERIDAIESRLSSLEGRARVLEEREEIVEQRIKTLTYESKLKIKADSKFKYDILYNRAKTELLEKNYRFEKNIFLKCILALSFIIFSAILMGFETKLSMLLGSVFIVITLIIVLLSLSQIFLYIFRFIQIRAKNASLDKTLISLLKINYNVVNSLEANKEFDIYDDTIDLDELITLEKKSLKKRMLNIIITFVVMLLFSLYINKFILSQTPYYFIDIIKMPLLYLNKVVII